MSKDIETRVDELMESVAKLDEELKGFGTPEPIVLENDEFDNFVDKCEEGAEPNEELRKALRHAVEQGFL